MKIKITSDQFKNLKGYLEHTGPNPKKDPTAKFIKCTGCKKLFTQTFHKKKKSLPICPWCLKHNVEQEVDERSRSFAFTRKKRLFSTPERLSNPLRFKEVDRQVDEISTYDLSVSPNGENKKIKKAQYKTILDDENSVFLKDMVIQGLDLQFYYNINDESTVELDIVDIDKKMKVAGAEFDLVGVDTFEASVPYVLKDYRNKGIATEMYKEILNFGDVVSGGMQSKSAIELWKKLFRDLPNKMVFVKDGNEYDVIMNNSGDLIVKNNPKIAIYDDSSASKLKLYRN
jgi:GNAT superfamily N-acetyltransferase